jgi:hypothetical protein
LPEGLWLWRLQFGASIDIRSGESGRQMMSAMTAAFPGSGRRDAMPGTSAPGQPVSLYRHTSGVLPQRRVADHFINNSARMGLRVGEAGEFLPIIVSHFGSIVSQVEKVPRHF